MNRNLVIALLLVAALGVAAYVLLGGEHRATRQATSGGGSATASSPRTSDTSSVKRAPPPVLPERAEDAGAGGTPFQRARSQAMANLQSELTQRIAVCAPSRTPPRPRTIRLVLEWRAEASTADLQQYVAKDVALIGGNADEVTPEVRACIDQLRGMPVPVFVNSDAIASEDRTMDASFEIPLP